MSHTPLEHPTVSRNDLILLAETLLMAVKSLARSARRFCVNELGIAWNEVSRDGGYFAEKMRECRRNQKALRERVRGSIPRRGASLAHPLEEIQLAGSIPDVICLLLSSDPAARPPEAAVLVPNQQHRLTDIEDHLCRHLTDEPADLRKLPVVDDRPRLDIALKFMAALFLRQRKLIRLEQGTRTVFLMMKSSGEAAVTGES